MKILHCVESYYPAPGGMQEVVRQLSERLAARGHSVTVATRTHPERIQNKINGVEIVSFSISGNAVNGYNGDPSEYRKFLSDSEYDVVTFFAAQQWATDIALPILGQIRGRKVSVPTGYSGLYWPQFQEYFQQMRHWIHGYDMNVYLSNDYRDINFARECGVTKYCIIPNGAGEDEFLGQPQTVDVRTALGLPEDCFLILHVGSFTGWKGQLEAAQIFLKAGLPNSALLLIGNNPENFKVPFRRNPLLFLKLKMKIGGGSRIIGRSASREFTVDAYKQADVFLFPSNIECSPIVLFECAAARLPFLSSQSGNAAEIAGWTGGGLILPTHIDEAGFSHVEVDSSAKMLRELYHDQQKRINMGDAAFKQWREKYSWEKITVQYEDLYRNLLNNGDHTA